MCGLVGMFCQHSVPDEKYIRILFDYASKRGQDGVGVNIIKKDRNEKILIYQCTKSYNDISDIVMEFIMKNLSVGDVLLGICRAQPETEPTSSIYDMQPIDKNNRLSLIHNGAISNRIHNELRNWSETTDMFTFDTKIDSESIIASYVKHNYNIKNAMEYISGGVAALMCDRDKGNLYIISDHQPISHCYIKADIGCYFLASDNDALRDIVKEATHTTADGVCLWEQWYAHPLRGHRIKCIDLESGFVSTQKYEPRFITNQWDSKLSIGDKNDEELILVATSGGLDSSTTLSMLKLAGYKNIIACHFKYGHRGDLCEEYALKSVCKELDIKYKIFDITDQMQDIDKTSMLMNKNAEIITGTESGLKTVAAWTPCRNMQFLTWMITYAEAEVIQHNYKEVQLLGGFLNLTESGVYGDNSENFISSFIEMCKYGSLIGDRLKLNYGLCDLTKSDQFELIKHFNLWEVYKHTISCDRPSLLPDFDNNGIIAKNCSKDGMPACGSGLLSYWGAKLSGINDMEKRNFYEIDGPYDAYIPDHIKDNKILEKDINNIIDRIHFNEENKNILRMRLTEIINKN